MDKSISRSLRLEPFASELFNSLDEFLVHFGQSEVFIFVHFQVAVEVIKGGLEGDVLFLELVELGVELFGLVVHGVDGFVGLEDLLGECFERALFRDELIF
jgi:hypothetical protein